MRADWFRFSGLEVADATLRGHYELDGRHFSEEIVFEGVDTLRRPALVAVAELWYLLAGLSYYKAGAAEVLIAEALAERIGPEFAVASFLRDRSELWVAQRFAEARRYHRVFRSCNRAFTQRVGEREATWCGHCDKCLFINLILAPFIDRAQLREIFSSEPLSDPQLDESLRSLIGLGLEHKPFECVGDPDESAVALRQVSQLPAWADVTRLGELARLTSPDREVDELLQPQGRSRVPAHWLR